MGMRGAGLFGVTWEVIGCMYIGYVCRGSVEN
jgi:hypothetical protein